MTKRQEEIFEKIARLRDQLEDFRWEMNVLRDAYDILGCERDAAIQRAEQAEIEAGRLRKALISIRDGRLPQVCSRYESCDHTGCEASYAAFVIADRALAQESSEEKESVHE